MILFDIFASQISAKKKPTQPFGQVGNNKSKPEEEEGVLTSSSTVASYGEIIGAILLQ
jgi:hypothetical protein